MATNTVRMKFLYADADTRTYDLPCDDDNLPAVKSKIRQINSSLEAETDGGMADFFLSDNGEALTKISEAQIISVTETVLDLGGAQ